MMTKKLKYIYIAIYIIVPVIMYFFLQWYLQIEVFSTVLYTDGTLIIEESSLDKEENKEKHGSVIKEYPSFEEDGYIFDNEDHLPYWQKDKDWIKSIEIGHRIQPTDMSFWFNDLYYVESIDVSKVDTSQVKSMAYLFKEAGCFVDDTFVIKGLDSWNTSNVTDMQWMFRGAGSDAKNFKLDGGLDHWDTSKVRVMVFMFDLAGDEAKNWYIGDLSEWSTASIIAANNMFGNYSNNPNIDDRCSKWMDKFISASIVNAASENLNQSGGN